MIQRKPDKEAFERVCKELEEGHTPLNCRHIADVFGWPAVELFLVLSAPSPEYGRQIIEVLQKINDKLIMVNTKRSR